MSTLRFTLVTDGPTDAVLLHPLRWLLIKNGVVKPIECVWADLRQLPNPPTKLEDKIAAAFDLYPCDLIFIHRDAEKEPRADRVDQIQRAVKLVSADLFNDKPYVCVVPVRMTEAWLIFDESKLRLAAGNPAGTVRLSFPSLQKIEGMPDPKQTLHKLLCEATELPVRRLKKFSPTQAFYRLAELIEDFNPLRELSAFAALESDIQQVIKSAGWGKSEEG
jgi:hypothetical protein